MIVHERDMSDATKRPVGKQRISTNDASNYTIFGKTLREVSFFASTTAIFGGYELCLPLVVFNCVEELYRTGIYQSDLFCRLPDRQQLSKLIYIFDSTNPYQRYLAVNKTQRVSDYSTSTLLNKESTQDICALLSNYICSLPEPILPPYLFDPIWEWGRMDLDGEDSGVDRDETHVRRDRQGRRYSFPLSKSHSGPSEAAQIAIVQYLLHLLPYPHFSLLVYLLAFFSQVLMMGEENGMYSQELSRLFGTYLFGGETLSKSASCDFSGLERNGTRNEKGGERMMRWFLERWGSISDGLFDIFDEDSIDGRSASLITQLKRNNSPINLDATPSPSAWTPTHKTYDELFQFSERTLSLATSPTTVEQEGDKGKGKERDILDGPGFVKRSVHFEVPAPDAADEMTSPSELSEEPKSPTDGRAEPELMTIDASVDSAPAVKDRLLDLSLSPAFNVSHLFQTLKLTEPPRTPKPAAQVSTSNSYIPPIEEQLHQARHQIRALKQALEESNAVTAEALEETYVARRHSMSLEKQLRVLEMGVGNRDSGRS
ncbi:hypothetical protein AMATHDRAFT_43827 [Amanita thiersii Skay4041]|uniref:Rho-GAP domain-containing protein n=1 Tax=Amanita thiersii Skay4041 TaxID=703135 RepID=A0A2A9NEG8_9AGAR|nr:hypothetical protein AMATHDRAFT_43827 [Amanita thiersii Skay4041]